jgi:hypothetical protein
MESPISDPYVEAIRALNAVFDAFGGQGVVIGGVAVGLLANPRFTKDVDGLLVLDTAEAGRLLEVAAACGFEPRFSGMLDVAIQSRIVALRHRPTGVLVDISLGALPFEEEVLQRAQEFRHEDFAVRLPTPEDLVILKAIAHRDQDMADIRAIVEVYPDLDRKRIKFWVREFADLLGSPEIWDDIEPLLESKGRKRK